MASSIFFCQRCSTPTHGSLFGGASSGLCSRCDAVVQQQMQATVNAFAQQQQQQRYQPTKPWRWSGTWGSNAASPQGGTTPVSPQTSCRIWWDASVSAYRLSSSFNKDLVDSLKTSIPVSDRSFDPQSKIWTITERFFDPTLRVIKLLGINPTVITRAQAETAQTSSASGSSRNKPLDSVIIEFVKTLPYEAAQKAYRHAAMLLHPDRGGSMEKMSALNAAWERISKEVYSQ